MFKIKSLSTQRLISTYVYYVGKYKKSAIKFQYDINISLVQELHCKKNRLKNPGKTPVGNQYGKVHWVLKNDRKMSAMSRSLCLPGDLSPCL